jgi:hypothetical protein
MKEIIAEEKVLFVGQLEYTHTQVLCAAAASMMTYPGTL